MPKLTEYKKIYGPADLRLKDKERVWPVIGESASATTFFVSNTRSTVYVAQSPAEPVQYLFTTEFLLGRVVPTIAKFIGFSKTKELGYYSAVGNDLTLITPETQWGGDNVTAAAVNIAAYYGGKPRRAQDDNGNQWDCRITITQGAWSAVERQQTAADPASIKGILLGDTVWISPISKKKGDRCIKPEPYGWIFSTNGSVRLIDPSTSVTNPRPTSLTFSDVRNVK